MPKSMLAIHARIAALAHRLSELKPLAIDHRDVRGCSRKLWIEVQYLPAFLSRRLSDRILSSSDLQAISWMLDSAFENLDFAAALFQQDLVNAQKARAEYEKANALMKQMWLAAEEKWAEAPAEANNHFHRCQRALGDRDYDVTISEAQEAMRKGQLVIDRLRPMNPV